MIDNLFVRRKEEFHKINELLHEAIDVRKEMPDYVFKKKYKYFKFIYDYEAFSNEFWDILKNLTLISQDNSIILAVLKPHPEEYYYKYFGYYNYGVFPIDTTADQYTKFISHSPKDSPADAILYNSYYICWFSNSLNWIIYFDREYELCVLAYDDDEYSKILQASTIHHFKSITEALDHNLAVLDETRKILISNYSI